VSKEFKINIKDDMIISCDNFGISIIKDGKRRLIPDLVTQIKMGVLPYVIKLPTREFLEIPEGEPMPKIPLRKRPGKQPVMK